MDSTMNKPPAARLGRAAHKRNDEGAEPPTAAVGTRAQRACPVFTARNAQRFARNELAR